ncbi:hypothetical protein D3C85_1252610 [compost metagenome]
MIALLIPLALLSARLVKKPTVSGTIGKIQGKKNAAKPANKPNPKVTQREVGSAGVAVAVTAVPFLTVSTAVSLDTGILLLAMLSSLEPIVVNSISPISAVAVVSS